MKWTALATLLTLGTVHAQITPPPLLFAGMDGEHQLDDGTWLPFWGYGYAAEGVLSLPGPLLIYEQGSDNALSFVNDSPEGHTIHLHGLDVDQSNDGVPGTSFTVMPNQTGSYAFAATHTGTYLYHCHVTTTLHLTMGMYGLLLVTRPDGALWEGGPVVDRDVPLLFSDLERAVNQSPTDAFPFHTIRPDYFMVNGLSGTSLTASEDAAAAVPGERVALRLASMAYAKVTCHFPDEWNAEVAMSDGRPLPAPFAADSLELYPGERYTVVIDAPASNETFMEVAYFSMVSGALESVESVWLNTQLTGVQEPASTPAQLAVYPNPAVLCVHASLAAGPWAVHDATGKVRERGVHGTDGPWTLGIAGWPSGPYLLRDAAGRTARFFVN